MWVLFAVNKFMISKFSLKDSSGYDEDVLSLNFAPAFVVAVTATKSVRFERDGDALTNDAGFELVEGEAQNVYNPSTAALSDEQKVEVEDSNTPESTISDAPVAEETVETTDAGDASNTTDAGISDAPATDAPVATDAPATDGVDAPAADAPKDEAVTA